MKKLTDLAYSKVKYKTFISSLNIYPADNPFLTIKIEFSMVEAAYLSFGKYTPILSEGKINRINHRYFASITPLGILFRLIYSFFSMPVSHRWYKRIYMSRRTFIIDFAPLASVPKRIYIENYFNEFLCLQIFLIALVSLVRCD